MEHFQLVLKCLIKPIQSMPLNMNNVRRFNNIWWECTSISWYFYLGFPCVFGLLPNRLKGSYRFMFQELKSIATQMQLSFKPQYVMTDFEPGLISIIATEVSPSCSFLVKLNFYIIFSFLKQHIYLVISTLHKLFIELFNVLVYIPVIITMMMLNIFVEN